MNKPEILSVQKTHQEWLKEEFLLTLKDGRQISFVVPRWSDYKTKLSEAILTLDLGR